MKGFLHFIREQGTIGLAVGFILGGAVSGLVKSLVDDVINPLLGLLLGKVGGLMEATFTIGTAIIKYGNLLNTIINFMVVAAVVYFGVKGFGLDRLDKKNA